MAPAKKITAKSAAAKKAVSTARRVLKGKHGKVVEIRNKTHFYQPKTLALARAPKVVRHAVPRRNKLDKYRIIKSPLTTESAMKKIEDNNTLVFLVDKLANKRQIKDAVKQMYDIKALKINTLIRIASSYCSEVTALLLSAIPPTLQSIVEIIQSRTFDLIAVTVVLSIALSATVAALTSDAKLLLVKDSFLTFLFGMTYLLSIFCGKENLICTYNRQFSGPEAKARLDEMYKNPRVIKATELMCYVWAAGLIGESLIRLVLIYTIPLRIMPYISTSLMFVTLTSLACWNIWYAKRLKKRKAQKEEESQEASKTSVEAV
ncbi:60S ribosomal protein L23a [Thraustotheca clavata]|uniref:60S ribosomal protein L23a n=1 Tax=Thraustotheca clavata TaxID=74557 RepID=A0A1W0A1B2_9STRA|nr:60S ribosomal protein L23a [Thraustotheca clavata]